MLQFLVFMSCGHTDCLFFGLSELPGGLKIAPIFLKTASSVLAYNSNLRLRLKIQHMNIPSKPNAKLIVSRYEGVVYQYVTNQILDSHYPLDNRTPDRSVAVATS